MKHHFKYFQFIIILIVSSFHSLSVFASISITAGGNLSDTIDSSDLLGGAGTDLASDYESSTSQVTISINSTTGPSDTWRVDVKRSDSTWDGNFTLYVKRTADGTGSGSISGGTSYQEVTGTDQTFFSGAGDRSSITVQIKLAGVSVQIDPKSYSSTVYFTVVDTDSKRSYAIPVYDFVKRKLDNRQKVKRKHALQK